MIGRDGQYHVSTWPPGWRSDRRRVPATLTEIDGQWTITDVHGQTWPVSSHAEVLAVAAHPYPEETTKPTKLDVFVDRLPHYPWLEEAMADEHTTAYARGRSRIGGLICQYGRLKIRIEEAACWGAEAADYDFLCLLRSLYDLLGVGAYPTPGGLGMSAMEESYLSAGYPRQSRPSEALRSALLNHRIGGRNDWTDSAEVYDQVWEADQRNAYCSAAALPLPVGGVVRFLKGEVTIGTLPPSGRDPVGQSQGGTGRRNGAPDLVSGPGDDVGERRPYRTWFARCICFNTKRQANSPILERLASGRLMPFTRQGYIEKWLWREEAEAFATREGCYVEVLDGWGWRTMEPVLRPWAETMHRVRAEAAKVSVELERMVKLCIVAAIGRHGCHPERRSVVPLRQAQEGNAVLTDTLDAQWATHSESEMDAPWITPWHEHIVAMIRLMNYRLQMEEAERHNTILASNVDAVYFLNKPAIIHQPDVLGGWRIRDKHTVSFPYARGLLSEEKISLPGLPRGSPLRKEMVKK